MSLGGREAAELLANHGIVPRKALGQNFVVDPNTIERIVRIAGITPGDHVVEIGPGLGSLTGAIADCGAAVVAVEVDKTLLPPLREHLADRDVRVIHDDAMTLRWADELSAASSWKLVANLPYNVATPLVLDILPAIGAVHTMTVMVQREVGERLVAAPGSGAYGIPSVVVRYWANAKLQGRVPPTVFLPKPRVESAIVTIERKADVAVDHEHRREFDSMMRLVRTAFNQRRKMLRASLGSLVSADVFGVAGVLSTSRPEQLDVDEWLALARAVDASRPS